MALTDNADAARTDAVPQAPPAQTGAAAGNPAALALPIFTVGSIALGLSLVGYVPAAAGGVIVPLIFLATGLGLLVSAAWAAALGQTMPASIFGLFAGFWLSFAMLVMGLDHNWLLIPAANITKAVGLFLISWAIIFLFLTLALARLPAAFPGLIALVVIALACRIIGVLDNSNGMNHVAGVIVLVFAALGAYLFLDVADQATGGAGLPLGPALRR